MLSTQQRNDLLETLKKMDREITLEIQLVTAWIEEHRATKPPCAEAPSLPDERSTLRSWRKTSYHLHQRRSRLKNKLENIRMRLHAMAERKKVVNMAAPCSPITPSLSTIRPSIFYTSNAGGDSSFLHETW